MNVEGAALVLGGRVAPVAALGHRTGLGDALVGIIGAGCLTGQVIVLDGGVALRAD